MFCIIGDDDGINPEIVDAARLLEINNIDCLSINTITNYVWPNSGIPPTFLTKKSDSNLYMSELKGYFKKANVDAELNKFISNGAINYLNYNLPKLYHGIVKKESLDKIKDIVGNYLDGLSPDIFCINISILYFEKSVCYRLSSYNSWSMFCKCFCKRRFIENKFKKTKFRSTF